MDVVLVLALVPVLGVVAGGLTTVAGIGGGMVLTLVLAAVWDPHHALAVAAPALILGNAHRLWLLRRDVDRRVAFTLAIPALLGSLGGGLLAAALPDTVIRWALLAITIVAIARERGLRWPAPGRTWLAGGGVVVGVVGATTGGGGLVLGPLLLAAGPRGQAFVATIAVVAVAMHVGQVAAFGTIGLLRATELWLAIGLGIAIVVGNLVGRHLRPHLGEQACHRVTWGTLLGGLMLALLGIR